MDVTRRQDDDRVWEHRLFPFLVAAFGLAAGTTLVSHAPRELAPALRAGALPVTFLSTASLGSPADLIPLEIADVVLPEGASNGVVLLRDKTSQFVLPVFLPAGESGRIRDGLKTGAPNRSFATQVKTPDTLRRLVSALGAEVTRIELLQGVTGPIESRIVLQEAGKEVALDSDLGEALALALETHRPIFTLSRTLASQGIRRDAVAHLPGGVPSHLRDPDTL